MEIHNNERKLSKFSLKPIFRLLVAIGVIAFATSITAVSCGKTAGGGGDNNSGNNSGGGGDNKPLVATTNLVLQSPTGGTPSYVKISGNTVTINAAGLAGVITPKSDADPNNRGYHDTSAVDNAIHIFDISYPGTNNDAVMVFVSRTHVTKDTVTIPATLTALSSCPSNEDTENALATAGNAICRVHSIPDSRLYFYNYLGTVFNNTDTANHARGLMQCSVNLLKDIPALGRNEVITDTTVFDRDSGANCRISVVNSGGSAAAAEIDDTWVGNAASTTEVELYAIGINVTGKTIPQFSDAAGYNFTEFNKAHDNAAFKRLLRTNPWGELKFKVKIVNSTAFAALP